VALTKGSLAQHADSLDGLVIALLNNTSLS